MLTEQQQNFRNAMSKLSAAVSIITTDGEAGKCGLTATAVCSVTDTPPTIMVCINTNSQSNLIFQQNKILCINVLAGDQEDLAMHFAGARGSSMEERFGWDLWEEKTGYAPMLKSALSSLQGKIVSAQTVGTHSLFLAELNHIEVREKPALVYFKRAFHQIEG